MIADKARSVMLTALLDGRALTAGELAKAANVTPQTASSHLSKLLQAHFLEMTAQGRHRYYRLKGQEIDGLIESLQGFAAASIKTGPADPRLRRARVCYDHLAGEAGVRMFDSMLLNSWLHASESFLVDWSERRYHLAGPVAAEIFNRLLDNDWLRRDKQGRALTFTIDGDRKFHDFFPIGS